MPNIPRDQPSTPVPKLERGPTSRGLLMRLSGVERALAYFDIERPRVLVELRARRVRDVRVARAVCAARGQPTNLKVLVATQVQLRQARRRGKQRLATVKAHMQGRRLTSGRLLARITGIERAIALLDATRPRLLLELRARGVPDTLTATAVCHGLRRPVTLATLAATQDVLRHARRRANASAIPVGPIPTEMVGAPAPTASASKPR